MSKKQNIAQVFHIDLYGKREAKYDFLNENSIASIDWTILEPDEPNFFFVRKDDTGLNDYEKGFRVDGLFPLNASGIKTQRDDASIKFTQKECDEIKKDFLSLTNDQLVTKYGFKDVRDWTIDGARNDLQTNKIIARKIAYRPFDIRFINFTGKTKGIQGYPRLDIMKQFINNDNICLITCRQQSTFDFQHIFLCKNLVDINSISLQSKEISYVFPLYLYPEANGQQTIGQTTERQPNLNPEIVKQIADKLGLTFTNEKTSPTPPKEGLSSSPLERSGKAGYITANAKNYLLIKEMRDILKDNPTKAEKVMWEYLRNEKTGHKIRRQHIIDDFITDFVCLSKKVVIEIDGKIHLQQKEYDELRTARLNQLGYEVIRFTNEEVYANPEMVASKIKQKLDSKSELQSDEIQPNLPKVQEQNSHPLDGQLQEPNSPPLDGQVQEQNSLSLDGQLQEQNSPPLDGQLQEQNSPPLEGQGEVFAPIDILDYIYAVLHSPSYREKYKEFLKIDFPRVPYPKDAATFWQLVNLGSQIRQIHLLESPTVEKYITQYPIDGDNVVTKPRFQNSPPSEGCPTGGVVGKVYINETQYFNNVPQVAWEFYIGGYQPAQKWLKDRKDRKLEFEDILHYQKIIVALTETDRLMKEINQIDIE